MARRNLLNLGRDRSAWWPVLVGVGLTVATFFAVAMAPSGVVEKFPRAILPAIYIGAIVAWCRREMGAELEHHKDQPGGFFSGWTIFGVSIMGLIATLLIALPIFVYGPKSATDTAYQKGWDRVVANENKALELATVASKEGVTEQELVKVLDQTFVPAWDDSAQAVTEMESLKMLDKSTTDQRTALRTYVTLQQQRGKLLREVLTTGDEAAGKALEKTMADIEKIDLTAK